MKKDDLADAFRLNTIQTIRINAKLNVMIDLLAKMIAAQNGVPEDEIHQQIDQMMQQEIADQFEQASKEVNNP